MTTLVLFEADALAGKAEELTTLFEEVLVDTRAYDGCEGVTVHRDQDAPDRLVLLERWVSRPHYEAYLQWRAEQGDPRLAALLTEPPSIRFLDDVQAQGPTFRGRAWAGCEPQRATRVLEPTPSA
ncbi:MAG TPA: antibiotic biosynthesis monooxygenase [Solirubrobacteraceae bacterium]|nr:antibiotic biosynthesis monooxygenase [Solirubrobacteraceae bacterium]